MHEARDWHFCLVIPTSISRLAQGLDMLLWWENKHLLSALTASLLNLRSWNFSHSIVLSGSSTYNERNELFKTNFRFISCFEHFTTVTLNALQLTWSFYDLKPNIYLQCFCLKNTTSCFFGSRNNKIKVLKVLKHEIEFGYSALTENRKLSVYTGFSDYI